MAIFCTVPKAEKTWIRKKGLENTTKPVLLYNKHGDITSIKFWVQQTAQFFHLDL
jgi:hypothetical protein